MKQTVFLFAILGMLLFFVPPTQEPQRTPTALRTWEVADSKAYARDKLNEWGYNQWSCLSKLWGKESAWNPTAYNTVKVMGKNAGGIPQLLGLDPKTPPPLQIDRGLEYIYYRYTTPCLAWSFFERKGWY